MMRNENSLVRQPAGAIEGAAGLQGEVERRVSVQIGETAGKLAELAAKIRALLGEAFAPILPATEADAAIILDWLASGRKAQSAKTQREYLRDLCGPAIGFLMFTGAKPLSLVTREDVKRYAEALAAATIPATARRAEHSLSIATRRRMMAAVKGLLTHANGLGLIPFNAGKAVALPSLPRSKRDKALTRGQSLTLQAVADIRANSETHRATRWRDALLSRLLYLTGARISEALALEWRDLYATDRGAELKIRHGKGDKERVLSLPADVYADLCAMRADRGAPEDAYIFTSQKGGRLSAAQAWRIVGKLAGAANLGRRIGPHTFRHSVATQLLDAGAPLHQVSEFLGHSDPRVTIESYYSESAALDVAEYLGK